MAETAGEKTLAPTEKRIKDAVKSGDVLRSKDLAVAATMLAGAAFLKAAGPWLFTSLEGSMRLGLTWDRASLDDFDPGRTLMQLVWLVLPPVLALGGCMMLVTVVAQLGITGPGRFNFANILPKASKLNPANGLTRMFGAQGWIEVGKGLLKLGLLGGIAYHWVLGRMEGLMELGAVSLGGQLTYAWVALTSLLMELSFGLVVIGMIDFPIQWVRRRARLRMSLQEVKDEHKEADGNPENKAKIRNRQRQMAMAGIANSMKRAQFVITNPTHFAVAMTYDPELAAAPVVLAKGRGEKAMAIRELAAELGLPCLEYPALARSVYYTTREMQMIREELYGAVAGVLAFVFSLKRGEKRPAPEIDVPIELRYDTDGRLVPDDHSNPPPTP